jgi:thiamine biosynthesis lipoprotein
VGYTNLVLDHIKQKAKLLKKDMTLDLGGIAKGYAADRMLEICKLHNLPRVLINAGGDILLGNAPRGKNGWLVEIGGRKHPDFPILTLSNTAIATSGDIEQSVTINEKTYSHLINPSTGIGLTSLAQVTVIAPTAMNADSLASACLVLGLEKSKTLLHSKKQVTAYYLIQDEGNLILSRINEDN